MITSHETVCIFYFPRWMSYRCVLCDQGWKERRVGEGGWITVTLQALLNPLQISFNHPWHFLQPHFFYTLSRENTSLTFISTGIICFYAIFCDWSANYFQFSFSLLLKAIYFFSHCLSFIWAFLNYSIWTSNIRFLLSTFLHSLHILRFSAITSTQYGRLKMASNVLTRVESDRVSDSTWQLIIG